MFSNLDAYYLLDEEIVVEKLIQAAHLPPENLLAIQDFAKNLVSTVRETRLSQSGLDAFLTQYHLASEEGIALMCLAEALLRIPDKETADKLIEDKVAAADWVEHAGKSDSLFVNAATWGLMLTGKIVSVSETENLKNTLKKLVSASSKPFIRKAIGQAMKILGKQFVMGRTIDEAVQRAKKLEAKGYCFSYDMLGEAARTYADADHYFKAYEDAIQYIKNTTAGISIKLSALHPRYEFSQKETVVPILTEKLLSLALKAKLANVGLTIDAEEADRFDISLEIIAAVFRHPALEEYTQLGLALQSYQKRAFYAIDALAALAKTAKKPLMIRLIKGAYWDSEIKNAQVKGLKGYPVFTRKIATDVSFLACAKKILDYGELFSPAFATHNAYSLAMFTWHGIYTLQSNCWQKKSRYSLSCLCTRWRT
jgi:RHH-type proline utilization regulon transcriptional repressor/proline dehydrogenase/delta 1-pyrroline-5-carboxylate dehydrogenase